MPLMHVVGGRKHQPRRVIFVEHLQRQKILSYLRKPRRVIVAEHLQRRNKQKFRRAMVKNFRTVSLQKTINNLEIWILRIYFTINAMCFLKFMYFFIIAMFLRNLLVQVIKKIIENNCSNYWTTKQKKSISSFYLFPNSIYRTCHPNSVRKNNFYEFKLKPAIVIFKFGFGYSKIIRTWFGVILSVFISIRKLFKEFSILKMPQKKWGKCYYRKMCTRSSPV